MGDVEQRTSYWVAVPVLPLSPGAVQVSRTLLAEAEPAARFATADGGNVSAGGMTWLPPQEGRNRNPTLAPRRVMRRDARVAFGVAHIAGASS
jgi:hypothetical protein